MEVLLEIGKLLKDALGHNRAHDARYSRGFHPSAYFL